MLSNARAEVLGDEDLLHLPSLGPRGHKSEHCLAFSAQFYLVVFVDPLLLLCPVSALSFSRVTFPDYPGRQDVSRMLIW